MIQESINQLLTTAGIASRLNPNIDKKVAGKTLAKKALAAQSALGDIAGNLENPKKKYTSTELEDIESRVKEHNKNIYTAKTEAISNPYVKEEGLLHQSEYSPMLSRIESGLEMRKKALQRMKEKGLSAVGQNNDFKEYRESILLGADAKPMKVEV